MNIKVRNEDVEMYENQGFSAGTPMKTKTPMSKPKLQNVQFEDDIWCMFYKLGFRILNRDENLRVKWGDNENDTQQLDVVAVGEDAIFVVECKSAEHSRTRDFKTELNVMVQYMPGVTNALQQVYGTDKRVKFIFATRNYKFSDEGEDISRMRNNSIYHLNENSYNYITNLISSYKGAVKYQFYGLMFKDELINNERITIPALRGKMGDKNYFLFSVEPSILLKIGFVLHRTRVNDSLAPTYQRLLIPSRLKGITKFIDNGGYFPNSIIVNFAAATDQLKVVFDTIHKEPDSDSEFGLLSIPNAYGIAYIIDGQHRVYGYANSDLKDKNTVPVVAFENMDSEEQLKIFMDINQNQKAVSPSLKLDLEEDLKWNDPRLDCKMSALRSSTVKALAANSNYMLYNKISIGEDSASLSLKPFYEALKKSGLIPKATQTKWVGDTDTCLYDINETNFDKAMTDSRKQIVQLIDEAYRIADDIIDDDKKADFLYSNRATYPFVVLLGLLHSHLIKSGLIQPSSSMKDRISVIKPYIETLASGLNSMSDGDMANLKNFLGQGADGFWLHYYQSIINKKYPDYNPEELIKWKETQDEDVQKEGNKLKSDIKLILREVVFSRLKLVYGDSWLNNVRMIKNACENRILQTCGEDYSFDDEEWIEWIEISDFKEIIDKNFTQHIQFQEAFAIRVDNFSPFKSKKDKLSWLSLIELREGRRKIALTRSDINRLWLIYNHLNGFIEGE